MLLLVIVNEKSAQGHFIHTFMHFCRSEVTFKEEKDRTWHARRACVGVDMRRNDEGLREHFASPSSLIVTCGSQLSVETNRNRSRLMKNAGTTETGESYRR